MKKKCLLIFKWPVYAQKYLINKFAKFYDVEYVQINSFVNKSYSEITAEINELIKSKNIEIVFFDVDFIKFINFFFIKKINNVKKILMTFDDNILHEMNAITANACDLVLTHCPLSVKKYEEKGYEVFFMPCESDGDIFKNHNLRKEIDVLFFGQVTPDRKEFIEFIESHEISIKTVDFTPEEELSKLISKSRIVLNLSKSKGSSVMNYISEDTYEYFYQFKGRIIMTGLCGTLCVSEYSPGQSIMFHEDEIPTFYTKEECVKILKKFLRDEELLTKHTARFSSKVYELCEDKKNFQPIYSAIEKSNHRRPKLVKIPYWYLRIVAKQVLLRNIKLSRLLIAISEFNEIFKIIRNTNLSTKFLIIFESVINTLWYSLTSTLKNKK